MYIAKIGKNKYVGTDENGSFVAVEGIENAYHGVSGELDESAKILGNGNEEIIEVMDRGDILTYLMNELPKSIDHDYDDEDCGVAYITDTTTCKEYKISITEV